MTLIKNILGKTGFSLHGEWKAGSYDRLALVSYLGSSFASLVDNNTAPLTDADKWMVIATKGNKGDRGYITQLKIGAVSSGKQASVKFTDDGIDEDGNPIKKINFVLEKGETGDVPIIEIGRVMTGDPGSNAIIELVPDGVSDSGVQKYLLNATFPRGDRGLPGIGSGNVYATGDGLQAGKQYLFVPSSVESTEGTFVEYVAPKQVQVNWNETDTTHPSHILNIPSSFPPMAHRHSKSEITDFPISLPASDVSAWAKAATKPSYSASEVGAATSGHNHSGVYEPVFTKGSAFNKNFGTGAGTVCQGNDSRLNDRRDPFNHILTENTDLNSLTSLGNFFCPSNAIVNTLKNCPTGNAFCMLIGDHAGVYQRIVEYVTANPKIFFRNKYDNTWGAWFREYTSIDPPPLVTTSSNGLMSAVDKQRLDKTVVPSDITVISSLSGAPVNKYNLKFTYTGATVQAISFATAPAEGFECVISIYNSTSADITQPLPNAAPWQSEESSVVLTAGTVSEISIRYIHGKYIIRV